MTDRMRFRGLVTLARNSLRSAPTLYRMAGQIHHFTLFVVEFVYIKLKHKGVIFNALSYSRLEHLKALGYQSQYGQEFFLVSSELIPKKSGFFLEIGGNQPVYLSNSYYLEKFLGYRGIAIDPIDFSDLWELERPDTKFITALISDEPKEVTFHEVSGDDPMDSMFSGVEQSVDYSGWQLNVQTRTIKTRSLQDVIDKEVADEIDVMFIDVEGHEMNVLASFGWVDKSPRVIVIENVGLLRKQEKVREFLVNVGYSFVARIAITDDVFVRKQREISPSRNTSPSRVLPETITS